MSITDGNIKSANANNACSRKKKFSKTATSIGQVEQTEEFEDSVIAEESGGKRRENSASTKAGVTKKRQNFQQEKLVNQVKLASQEKLVNQVNECPGKEEDRTINKSSVVKGNREKRNVAKSVRLSNEEAQSEDDEDDEEEDETCTEEDEPQGREENEQRAERKQRTKLVKKVKVRLRRCFYLGPFNRMINQRLFSPRKINIIKYLILTYFRD